AAGRADDRVRLCTCPCRRRPAMNAADQRRLSPWLAGACLLLAAVWAVLLAGAGRGIRWDAPTATRPLPAAGHDGAVVDAPPLTAYAEVWQRPLFTTDRRPVPVTAASDGQDASLDNLRLTGVILAPGMRMALLSDPDDGRTIRVAEGAHVGSGEDRKSTRLNSSHVSISYAVFCLKQQD